MKHLFYVHSGITYLVSLATIRQLNLAMSDVVLVYARNFSGDGRYPGLVLDNKENELGLLPSYGSSNVWKLRSILRKLDRKISNAVKDKFTAYLPSDRNYLMQFIQTHKLCVARNFIEEGLLTYHDGMERASLHNKSLSARIKHFLRAPFHNFRTSVSPYNNPSRGGTVYVATRQALAMLSHRQTILVDVRSVMNKSAKRVTNLLVLDPVVEMGLCDPAAYFECLEQFISSALPKDDLVHVKFHPRQAKLEQYHTIFLRQNVRYEVLNSSVILEELICSHPGMNTFGLSSSTLFYAQEWGIATTLFSKSLAVKDSAYKQYVIASFPSQIINSMNLI